MGVRLRWAPLEEPLANLCAKYALFVARHPLPFILVPVFLTALLSTSILQNFKIVRGVHYLYSPLHAPWKAEEAVFRNLWATDDDHFYPGKDFLLRKGLYIIVEAKDGGDVLRPDHAMEFIGFIDWMRQASFVTADSKVPYTYEDICLRFQNQCFSNTHARFIAEVFAKGHSSKFNVTYPHFASEYATEPIDVAKTLGGVEVDEFGYVKSAKNWLILYQLKQGTPLFAELSTDFELTVTSMIDSGQVPVQLLRLSYYHSETFDIELAEGNMRIAPRFTLTFVILVAFSVVCTFNLAWPTPGPHKKRYTTPVVDWVISKPLLGVAGVVSTLMAIVSSVGLMLWLDVTFVDMCSVMPFLSLTIGIDDTFLMLAAWHDTPRTSSVEQRVEATMRHAGVSIAITSVTDALAFLIGSIAPLPAVLYFCYYASAAICFIFLYTSTVFLACMTLLGRLEADLRHSLVICTRTVPLVRADIEPFWTRYFNLGSRPSEKDNPGVDVERGTKLWYQRFFSDVYAPFICHPASQAVALVSFVAYLVVTYFGIQRLVVGFDLINIVRSDAPPYRFLELQSQYFHGDVAKLDVAVLQPPNMGDAAQRTAFLTALTAIESTQCSGGRNTTDFWYFALERYFDGLGFGDAWMSDANTDEQAFLANLQSFLLANEKYAYDVLRTPDGTGIRAFRLTTLLRNYGTDERIQLCAEAVRSAAAQHEAFDIRTYSPLWNLADQFDIMWPQTLQDLYISAAVMMPLALLMIPQPFCAAAIGASIMSIGLGVIGFMAWWDVNLDATSMITIAMSVGFSVDFAAHCTYAYMAESSGGEKPYDRLAGALASVGWPITQGSLSVCLGISTLATVDTYVVQTCFKTVMLVILFGTTHALLYLPLVLMHTHEFYLFLCRKLSNSAR